MGGGGIVSQHLQARTVPSTCISNAPPLGQSMPSNLNINAAPGAAAGRVAAQTSAAEQAAVRLANSAEATLRLSIRWGLGRGQPPYHTIEGLGRLGRRLPGCLWGVACPRLPGPRGSQAACWPTPPRGTLLRGWPSPLPPGDLVSTGGEEVRQVCLQEFPAPDGPGRRPPAVCAACGGQRRVHWHSCSGATSVQGRARACGPRTGSAPGARQQRAGWVGWV